MDFAHKATDKELERLEKELKETYTQAQKEMQKKADSFFKQFEKADLKNKELLDAGEMTEKAYQDWRFQNITKGNRYKQFISDYSNAITNIDVQANEIINGSLPTTYALNYNYMAEEIEKGVGKDLGFNLVDIDTVNRLVRDNPELLPSPKIDIDENIKWNDKLIRRVS